MDERLTRRDPGRVRQLIALTVLSGPSVIARQGAITLAPHQVDAAMRLLPILTGRGGAVLADATGLGKTYVAIAVARLKSPALVVAPAALRGMWNESLGRAQVSAHVTSYEALSRGSHRVAERPRLVILDEAHHARNTGTRRYAAIADLTWGAEVLLLTATPIHNRARDLRGLVALFVGSRAESMPDDELRQLIVRREAADVERGEAIPGIESTQWIKVPSDPRTLRAIRELPPAVPAADGGSAHALLLLGLIRSWTSSEAALRAALRRRLRRSLALEAALESGRLPNRRELNAWPAVDDAIQLGFPEFLSGGTAAVDVSRVKAAITEHVEGVRAIISSLDRNGDASDDGRIVALQSVRTRHFPAPLVAFTQFADTAEAVFRRTVGQGGVALVTGRGARVASGRVAVEEITHGFDMRAEVRRAMPLNCLIATDVLSEGLSLRRAATLVHLDLPWTLARLDQRIGRLRRLGSPHRSIAVYAIGPPVESRELLTVVRTLQRKARLSAAIVGAAPLAHSLPLLGARLERATGALSRRNAATAVEQVRRTLRQWADDNLGTDTRTSSSEVGIGLVERPGGYALVAVDANGVSEDPREVQRAVAAIGTCSACGSRGSAGSEPVITALQRWLEEERGRKLAGLTSDAASAAHAAVLRVLQSRLARATRVERSMLAPRIERCRTLVAASRGAGAELALQRFAALGDGLDLNALAGQLDARLPNDLAPDVTRLVAILSSGPGGVSAWVDDRSELIAGSRRRGPPRSSTPRAAHGAAPE